MDNEIKTAQEVTRKSYKAGTEHGNYIIMDKVSRDGTVYTFKVKCNYCGYEIELNHNKLRSVRNIKGKPCLCKRDTH